MSLCKPSIPLIFSLFLGILSTTSVTAQLTKVGDPELPGKSSPLHFRVTRAFEEADLGYKANVAVVVRDVATGRTLVDINGMDSLKPASTIKAVTTSAALNILGPTYTFETQLYYSGVISNGILSGDVIIVGGGDPSFGSRFQEDKSDLLKPLRLWAKKLKDLGVKQINGNILGDDSRYTYEPHGLGWERMEFGEWYSAEVSALNFNENVVDVMWKGSGSAGRRASFSLFPETDYVQFSSSVRSIPRELSTPRIRYYRFAKSNEIRARGYIQTEDEFYDFAAVHDPAWYTATIFQETLEKEGIKVYGSPFSARMMEDVSELAERKFIDSQSSPPLEELIPVVNTESQNLYAEVLMREIAFQAGLEPSFKNGADAIIKWLRQNRINVTGILMVDGSGLSTLNKVTARSLNDVLLMQAKSRTGDLYINSFATPGEGSLKDRFQQMDYAGLKDRLKAKTGFLESVHALCGYLENRSGQKYAFTIIVNDFDSDRSKEARDMIDRMVLHLFNYDQFS